MNPALVFLRNVWLPKGWPLALLRRAALRAALATVALGAVLLVLEPVADPRERMLAERARLVALAERLARNLVRTGDEASLAALAGDLHDSGATRGVFARRADGSLLTVYGAVDLSLEHVPGAADFALIDLVGPRGRWGRLGLALGPLPGADYGVLGHPFAQLCWTFALCSFAGFALWLRYRPVHLQSPAAVLPDRVSTVMNGLIEGIALIDHQSRIVHCNRAFAHYFGVSGDELRGRSLSSFDWRPLEAGGPQARLPWEDALAIGRRQVDRSLRLMSETEGERVIAVNVTPMFDDRYQARAAVASFDDRTAIAHKNRALRKALAALERQRREIAKQNEELKGLATRDSLTGCLNRRAFLEIFEAELLAAQKRGYPLACLMCDIDRFKAINDGHGHTVGDRVIAEVAKLLQFAVRENDHICRYGGEEFCVLLPGLGGAEAAVIAERMRSTIESQTRDMVRLSGSDHVTASFGVADLAGGAGSLSELIDHADAALYSAKGAGRNRVAVHAPAPNVHPIGGARLKS